MCAQFGTQLRGEKQRFQGVRERLGLTGAAIATASAVLTESTLLFVVAKRRLGLHVFVWGGPSRG